MRPIISGYSFLSVKGRQKQRRWHSMVPEKSLFRGDYMVGGHLRLILMGFWDLQGTTYEQLHCYRWKDYCHLKNPPHLLDPSSACFNAHVLRPPTCFKRQESKKPCPAASAYSHQLVASYRKIQVLWTKYDSGGTFQIWLLHGFHSLMILGEFSGFFLSKCTWKQRGFLSTDVGAGILCP